MNDLDSLFPAAPASHFPQRKEIRGGRVLFLVGCAAACSAVATGGAAAAADVGMTARAACFGAALTAYACVWLLFTARRVRSHLNGGRHLMPAWAVLRLTALAASVWAAWSLAEAYAL